jgi:uncharacterized protein (TIGR02588 family)
MKREKRFSEGEAMPTTVEWITFGVASGVLATVLGLIGYAWLTTPQEPPILKVQSLAIREEDGQFYVPFEVVNTGGETAEAIQIIAELQIGEKVEEQGEQQIDFLSRKEKEAGAFIFSQDPRQGKLVLRVASYKLP